MTAGTPGSASKSSLAAYSTDAWNDQAVALLDRIREDFSLDNAYRQESLSLTASENYPSKLVRYLGGARQGSFYEFTPPYTAEAGEWYFPDLGAFRSLVGQLAGLGRALFRTATFDWRPNGGSAAEQALLLGVCRAGDGLLHFAHQDGGHFALETLAEAAGITVYHLPVAADSLHVDVDRLADLVSAHPDIKLAILDQSFKLRWQPLTEIRAALPDRVLLTYDASHDGALIAGGVLPQPILHGADVIHGNTHKTIPGPQKAYIAFRDADSPHLQSVSDWVFPHMQSNSHAELIAPMIVAFLEMSLFGHEYATQVVANAQALAVALHNEGFRVSGESFGFTETHQVHVAVGSPAEALHAVVETLPAAGIRTNNIEIPGTGGLHGLRLGVQAMTRRGLQESEMLPIARLIRRALIDREPGDRIRADAAALLIDYPVDRLAFSIDDHLDSPAAKQLLAEVWA